MTELERLKRRIAQLEEHWPSGKWMPPELTDEEYAGAPVAPWRVDMGGPLNPAAWDYMVQSYEKRLAQWRASNQRGEQ